MGQIIVLIVALVLRIIYLLQIKDGDPLFHHPIMDALYHHEWAVSIINGGVIGKDSFFRAPLYPYFLAVIYRVFGIGLVVPRIIQSTIGAVNCLLISKIGTGIFNRRIGLVAGLIAAVYPLFIYFDNELLIPTLLIFFVLLGFYLIMIQTRKPVSRTGWFFIGLVWGLAAITRPNVLIFLIPLFFWMIRVLRKNRGPAIGFACLGIIIVILPVTARNYLVGKEFVPIAWQGGINFYIGNNPSSDGVTAVIPGTRKTWWGGFNDARYIAEASMGRGLRNSEVDRYWFSQGCTFIRQEPAKAIDLFLKKVYLFFGGFEFSNNRDIYFFTSRTFLRYLVFATTVFQFPFGLLMPLALTGMLLCFIMFPSGWFSKQQKAMIVLAISFIVSYSFSIIIFFVTARYRMAVIPFLIVFAVCGVFFFIRAVRERRVKGILLSMAIFVLSLFFLNANLYRARPSNLALSYLSVGVAYRQKGEIRKAMDSYLKAIEVDPSLSDGYLDLGNLYAAMRRHGEAKQAFLKAIEVDSSSAQAFNSLGNIYFEDGSYDMALECYEKAFHLEPDYVSPLFNAGVIYQHLGRRTEAESLWRRVLEISPGHHAAEKALRGIK